MNMLRNIKFYLSALAILVGATSCLDKYPGSSIPEKEAMRTFADAEQTLTGIYASLKSNALYSGYLTLLPDIQADLVYAVEGNTNTYGSFWRWDIRPTDLQLEAVYAALYKVIGNCNFYLDRIDEVVANEISDTNIEKLEQYTGEVYAVRALCYTELLKTFCKAYEPDTAQSELGVVLRTKYFTPEAARRASLYDSYQFVLDDLAEAEKRLDKENDAYGNVYMTSASAEALHARVALYMQDWDTAIEYSSTLIDEKKATFQLSDAKTNYTSDYTYFDYMWAYDLGYEVIWRIGFTETSYGSQLQQGLHLFLSRLCPRPGCPGSLRRCRPALFGLLLPDRDRLCPRAELAAAGQILRQPQPDRQPDLPCLDAQAVPPGGAVPDPRRGLLPKERFFEGRQRPLDAA